MDDFLQAVMKSERLSAVIKVGSRGHWRRDASGLAPAAEIHQHVPSLNSS